MKKLLIVISLTLLSLSTLAAQQVGYGVGLRLGAYDWYGNPPDDIASRSAGSAILNIGISPKLWFGGNDFSISPEVGVVFSPLALSLGDYKGLGAVSFPMMVKFEFLGNSNFNRDGKLGFSIGGGIQYNKTELWYLKPSFKEQGVNRSNFKTYIIEVDFGYGLSGFDAHVFVRYGWNNSLGANTFSIGIGADLNVPVLIDATDPDF